MSVEIVFNELSSTASFESKQAARIKMTQFINTLLIATSKGAKRTLCTTESFNFLQLSPNYQIVQWRNDPAVEREERSFLRALLSRQDSPLPEIADVSIDTRYKGTRSIGLEYAAVCEGLAVSLASDEQWNCNRLPITIQKLEDDEVIEDRIEIRHASAKEHILSHADWILERSRTLIVDGQDLWNRRSELLPHLELCNSMAAQLGSLKVGNPMLLPVIGRLFELDSYCKTWRTGPFSPDKLPCKTTTDSQTTLQRYGPERTFFCPDGEQRIFSWHVRLPSLAWRMYFIPQEPVSETKTGTMLVGYVGKHLRTVKFN